MTAQGVTPTSTQNTDSYTYSSSAWGDLLTSFDGRAITYDEIGNPLTYNNGVGYTFTWSGRQMTSLVKSNVTYSFTYNDEGIRTTKTKAGVTTTYYLSGSQIIGEETNGNITLYVYDSDGAPLGMQYHAASYAADVWDVYWFEKNLFGDVVAVYDETGTKLISYEYNAYGNWWSMQYNGGYSTTAYNNPFRYRGYYYDRDLELYVLNSRYYDPYTCRFISPDDVSYLGANGDLNSYNLYAYCSNNSVNYKQSILQNSSLRVNSSTCCGSSSIITSGIEIEKNVGMVSSSTYRVNLFGYQKRLSAGWEDSSSFITGFLGSIGFSTSETNIKGQPGVLYGFIGSTSDTMNWFKTTYYAGVGINLFDVFGIETQIETVGIAHQVSIGNFSVGTNINLIGGTSVAFMWNTDLDNGVVETDGIVFRVNTGMLIAAICWIYQLLTTGNTAPVPGLQPA